MQRILVLSKHYRKPLVEIFQTCDPACGPMIAGGGGSASL